MILSTKAVNVPSQSEIDADLAEYGHIGQRCREVYGRAAIEAGSPDYPDGEGADAAHTGAVDAIANVLHWAIDEGCEVDAILDGARCHVHAEQGEKDEGEGVHAELGVSEFRTVDVGHVPLHRLADGEVFEDAAMKRWRKRHDGPTQSGVRVETLDGKLWQDYDLSTCVHQLDHEHTPRAGSRNRLTADTVEYQCDSCGVFYGVAE